MSDTQKRIAEYKKLLPGLKERVAAVALLLVISITMVTTTTFAWVVLSRSPEVTGVTTNIASNGNLEIALATGDGTTAPGESKVGDSSASENQSIVGANVTWGNMINLNDPAYGLDNLVLRPAQLNTTALLTSPLYGAEYGPDGRITQLNSNFAYALWNEPTEELPGQFVVSDQFGVRAISSTKSDTAGPARIYESLWKKAETDNLTASTTYKNLEKNQGYMNSLATMMGLYMTARMNSDDASLRNPTCNYEDIVNLRDMYAEFLSAFDQEFEAMASLLNVAVFLAYGQDSYTSYVYNAERVIESTSESFKIKNITATITGLTQFKKDRNTIASDLEKLTELAASGTSLKWKDSGINGIVNNLVNVGACTVDGTPISSIGASNAMGYLSGTHEARITNGILYRFEEYTGGHIDVKNMKITATIKRMGITVPGTVTANIKTSAPEDYNVFTNDLNTIKAMNNGQYAGGKLVAQDTFGLAVDFWVRTNANEHFLTLEGNILTEEKEVRATGKDTNGDAVELFILSRTVTTDSGESFTDSYDLYQLITKDGAGNETTTWYNAHTHAKFELQDGETPTPKMETIVTVIGYEGANRVWNGENSAMLSTDSTTQGSGSCYIYYADTPEDQARSLKLLEAMKVAFVSQSGAKMATAIMDTEHFFAENGKVIVPLVLDVGDSLVAEEDAAGNKQYAITALEKNVATRITAIVYLDGTKLSNDDVLAAADIQGQLNIQFGAYQPDLNNMDNEELMNKVLQVSASVDKTSFDYDTATDPMTTRVMVSVDGAEPNTVTAFFLRFISATQGSREEMMTFTKDEATGNWVADYTFTSPGNYILRSIRLDGVEYDLKTRPEVKVSGFTVENLLCTQADGTHITAMTANNSYPFDMQLKFATDDVNKMPQTVQGRFLKDEDGSAVNVNFTYNATTGQWIGNAAFLKSGNYTMKYLVLDGEYTELDEGLWQTASVTLGMRVAIYTTSPHNMKYIPSEMADNELLLGMQLKILDNAGNELPGLKNVKLTYGMKGSGKKAADTDLTWMGTYYEGDIPNPGPGIWQFVSVTVNGDIITSATTSPTFTVMPAEPPDYVGYATSVQYLYKPSNDAFVSVDIAYSATATVLATFKNLDNNTLIPVQGELDPEGADEDEDGRPINRWNFVLPSGSAVEGAQDGNWQLVDLSIWNYYEADGTYVEAELDENGKLVEGGKRDDPLVVDLADKNHKIKVVVTINVNFAPNQGKDFGKDSTGKITGVFMEEHTISGLNVVISDFENKPIEGVSAVTLKYTYQNNSEAYGGYTGASLTNALADFTVNLVADSSGTKFVQATPYVIKYAGSWLTTFSYKVGETEYTFSGQTLPANVPKFTVSSVTPTAMILGTDTYANASHTATSANVPVDMYYTESVVCGQTFRYKAYHQRHVTIQALGLGNATSARLVFTTTNTDGKVHLYTQEEGRTSTNAYEWTTNGNCQRYVGYWDSQTGDDDHTAAGTLKTEKLELTYGNETYTVDIPDITITNSD